MILHIHRLLIWLNNLAKLHDILGGSDDDSLSYGCFKAIFTVKVLLNFINQHFTKVHTLKGQRNFTALAAAAVMGVVLASTGPLCNEQWWWTEMGTNLWWSCVSNDFLFIVSRWMADIKLKHQRFLSKWKWYELKIDWIYEWMENEWM